MDKIVKFGVIGLGRGKSVMTDILGENNVPSELSVTRIPKKGQMLWTTLKSWV